MSPLEMSIVRSCSSRLRRRSVGNMLALASGVIALSNAPAGATTFTWTGTTDGNWTTSTNWSGPVAYSYANSVNHNFIFYAAGATNLSSIVLSGGANPDISQIAVVGTSPVTITLDGLSSRLDLQGSASSAPTTFSLVANSTLTVTGINSGSIQLQTGATQTWDIGSGANLNLNATIGISATGRGFTKTGLGTVSIGATSNAVDGIVTIAAGTLRIGNGANGSMTGLTDIRATAGGTLFIDNSASAAATRLGSSAIVSLGGGQYRGQGSSGAATTTTINGLVLTTLTSSVLTLEAGAGVDTNLVNQRLVVSNVFNRNPLSTLLVRGTAFGAFSPATTGVNSNNLIFTNAPTLVGIGADGSVTKGVLPGVVVETTRTATGSTAQLATYGAISGVRQLSSSEMSASLISNANVAPVGPLAATAETINSLTLSGGGNSVSIADTFTITSGQVLTRGNTNAVISGGTLAFSSASATLHTYGSLSIGSTLATSGGLVKSGSGNLTLTADNSATLTGPVAITGGTAYLTANGALGATGTANAATIQQAGGVFFDNTNYTAAKSITLTGSSSSNVTAVVTGSGFGAIDARGTSVFSGPISATGVGSASGDLGLNSIGAQANSTLTLNGALTSSSSATGFAKVGDGTVILNNSSSAITAIFRIFKGTLLVTNTTGVSTNSTGSVINGGTLGFSSASTLAYTGGVINISNGGSYAGVLQNFAGNNSYSGGVTLGGSSFVNQIGAASGSTFTISGVIGGSSLTKVDDGTLAISGTSTGTSLFTVSQGALALTGANGKVASFAQYFVVDNSNDLLGGQFTTGVLGAGTRGPGNATLIYDNSVSNTANRLGAGTITLSHGTLAVNGNAALTSVATGTLLASGAGTVTISPSGTAATTVTSTALNRAAGVLFVRGNNLGQTAGSGVAQLIFSTPPSLAAGSGTQIIPGVIASASSSGTPTDWATYGAAGVRPLTSGEYQTSFVSGGNLRAGATLGPVVSDTVSSLIADSGGGFALPVNATLTVSSGNIMALPGNTGFTGGTLAFGTTPATFYATADTTLDSQLAGSGGLVKVGSGKLTATGDNSSLSGQISVVGGTLSVAAANNIGSATGIIALNGAALTYTGVSPISLTRSIAVGGQGGMVDVQGGAVTLTTGLVRLTALEV